jgi:hypothetical protein
MLPLSQKVTWSRNRQDCFFANLINNGELYTAILNAHHTRSAVTWAYIFCDLPHPTTLLATPAEWRKARALKAILLFIFIVA